MNFDYSSLLRHLQFGMDSNMMVDFVVVPKMTMVLWYWHMVEYYYYYSYYVDFVDTDFGGSCSVVVDDSCCSCLALLLLS